MLIFAKNAIIYQMLETKTPQDKLAFVPPETHYIAIKRVVKIPISDEHFKDPWQLRLYAADLVQKQIGDEVQITALKVKKPHLLAKTAAKLRHQEPQARLFVTIKF